MILLTFSMACVMGCSGFTTGAGSNNQKSGGNSLQISTTSLPVASLNTSYSASLAATGGTAPYTWSTTAGQLPSGITLNTSSGALSGTPSQSGTFTFTAQVTDSNSATASGGLSLNVSSSAVPSITTVSPNTGSTTGGTTVTLSGNGFQSGSTVQFGTTAASSVNVVSATQLQAVTPAESASTVNVTVTAPSGQSAKDSNAFTFVTGNNGGPILPALPQANVDTSLPNTSTYTVTNVTAGQLQAALNAASCSPNGTILQLPQGDTETGNFTLPLKSCASGQWIIVTTAGVMQNTITNNQGQTGFPAPGTRLDPSLFVGKLATINTTNATSAIATATNSPVNHYRFIGVEVKSTANLTYNIFDIGGSSLTPSQLPSYIIIDRCYIHGSATNQIPRDVDVNGSNIAIVDSYLSEGHEVGFDAQAISGWSGAGPFLFQNNFLEGSGENILWGGSNIPTDQPPYNLFMTDVTVRKNFMYKPLAWRTSDPSYMGIHFAVKNLYEDKGTIRSLVEDNVMENNWLDAQNGEAVTFQPLIQSGTNVVMLDTTFRYNYLAHAAGCLDVTGRDVTLTPEDPVLRTHRFLVQNNLWDDVNPNAYGGTNICFQVSAGADALTFDHNTVPDLSNGTNFTVWGNNDIPETNFFFTNNIMAKATYGISVNGTGEGNPSISADLSGPPAGAFTDNVLQGANCSIYPSSTQCPSTMASVDFANFQTTGGDYRLCSAAGSPATSCTGASPYAAGQAHACQSNTNCGADIAGLDAAIAGVGVFPANPPSITLLSATSMVCNASNTLTITGTNLNLAGTQVVVNGVAVTPSSQTATQIVVVPPLLTGANVPVTVDNFGLPATVGLTCQ